MDKLTIYVVRHGRTIMNTLYRSQGWCDSPLTPEGIAVAEALGRGLRDIEFQAAYCSTLRRTLQTAKIILKEKGQTDIKVKEIDGFKEAGFGSYESHDEEDLWIKLSLFMGYVDPNEIDKDLRAGKLKYSDISDGIAKIDSWGIAEDWATIESRTQKALKEVAEKELRRGAKNVLLVSHAMAIAAMLLSLGGDKLIQGDLKNASVCKVEYQNGKFSVLSMGDMSYVEKGKIGVTEV